MKKVELIDAQQYFTESEKVIEIVKENKDKLRRNLPAKNRLKLAKDLLESAKSAAEHHELKKEIEELELEIKFDKGRVPAIPEEHQPKIAFNRVVEEEKLDAELEKQKQELNKLATIFEEQLLPTLKNIASLEKRKLVGKKIDILLDGHIISREINDRDALTDANYLSFSGGEERAHEAELIATKLNKQLRTIVTRPHDLTGLEKPSIFKKLLGGKK
ncbi:hypothetical protein [Planococcus sp. 107-1]|uniref:hypothetical protein n=1 Tax=Planococcus sp. 107-1 TaxID=2908840 RepID=UPI001F28FAF9|nr:hypothetical protein [Planococcus sp. 107-1]UJF27455.1 hypothetical protein L0M13_02880 [Planococcus sp. 107-1]